MSALRCGLLGRRLGHSYSPELHALFGDYEYRLYEREPEELSAFFSGGFDGLNVTMPYKKTAAAYCAELGVDAREAGCVNTIVRRADGSLFGENTDVFGFESLLAHGGIAAEGKKALVLGSGGAGAAASAALKRRGAREVVTVSRTGENNYHNLDRHADAQILVNATPVGMYPNNGEAPLDLRGFPKLEGVADVIYNPARTALLMQAERLGIPHAGGLRMLVAQAKRSSELFTGRRIDDAEIDRVERELARRTENLILLGMPGCGKTTIARLLAAATGREAFDSDELVCASAGMSVAEIFADFGESGFRDRETEALRELGKRSGCVIATGGGCVTREENYPLLHQNGRLVWLRRDIDRLPSDGRPLSQNGDLSALYAARAPLYERFADFTADNGGAPEETIKTIGGLMGWQDCV